MDPEQKITTSVSPASSIYRKLILVFTCIIILLSVSGGSYFLGKSQIVVNTHMKLSTTIALTPTPTPVYFPSPTISTGLVNQNTNQIYIDKDIPFSVFYPKNWILKKTYGKSISKLAPTDVLSGIQIDGNGTSTFVVNVIDGKNVNSIIDWWRTGSHTVFPITQPNFSFRGIDAIKVSSTPGGNPPARVQDEVYFLWRGNVYFLSMQYSPYNIDTDLVTMYDSFTLPQ